MNTTEKVAEIILKTFLERKFYILIPIVENEKGDHKEVFARLIKEGYLTIRLDGIIREMSLKMECNADVAHSIDLVIDRMVVRENNQQQSLQRINDDIAECLQMGASRLIIIDCDTDEVYQINDIESDNPVIKPMDDNAPACSKQKENVGGSISETSAKEPISAPVEESFHAVQKHELTSLPKVADADKSIPNKVLYISLTPDGVFTTGGRSVVYGHDLLNDIIYEIGAELAFLVKGIDITDKPALILDFKNERPDGFVMMCDNINRQIIEKLFLPEIPEEVDFEFPETYVEWLIYNTSNIKAEIGRTLRANNNSITISLEDIFSEYLVNEMLENIKRILDENSEITTLTIIDQDAENSRFINLLKNHRSNLIYTPFKGNWITAEIANMYNAGTNGVVKDQAKALEYYLKSAQDGNAFACNQVGFAYQNGLGTSVDHQKAIYWYGVAADKNDSFGHANLGYCYHVGIGTTVDLEKAAEEYEKAANNDIAIAQFNLALILFNKKNYSESYKWYKRNSENPFCHDINIVNYNLGTMLLNGQGVEKNEEEAMAYLRKASDGGYVEAHYLCGQLAEKGVGTFGQQPDVKWAQEFYERGKEAGNTKCIIAMVNYRMTLPQTIENQRSLMDLLKAVSDENAELSYKYAKYMYDNPEVANRWGDKTRIESILSNISDYAPAKELLDQILSIKEAERLKAEEAERQLKEAEEAARLREEEEQRKQKEIREANAKKNEAEQAARRELRLNAWKWYTQIDKAVRYISGKGSKRDYQQGVSMLVDAANVGHPLAKAWLGLYVIWLNPSSKEAFRLIESSTEKTNAKKFNILLAECYSDGDGPTKDINKAIKLLSEAFPIPGDCYAFLALCYLNGSCVAQDLDRAFDLLKIGRRLGSGDAYSITAQCYQNGWGVVQDLTKAGGFYEEAVKYENGNACSLLARMIVDGKFESRHFNPAELLKLSANYGDCAGMCNYADYLCSIGKKGDAESWYQRALRESLSQQVCDYATKCLKKIGGRVVPTAFENLPAVYFVDGVPSVEKPVGQDVLPETTPQQITSHEEPPVSETSDTQPQKKKGLFRKLFGK